MLDKFKDECGVFGIFGHPEAANMTYLGLYALQHRGQESAGIAASDGGHVRLSRAMGYVADVFDSATLSQLPGTLAIGHVPVRVIGRTGGSALRIAVDGRAAIHVSLDEAERAWTSALEHDFAAHVA